MDFLAKWLMAGAVLCIMGFFGIKDDKDAKKMSVCVLILGLLLGIAGYYCLQEKENDVIQYEHNSNGEYIPFDGNVELDYVSLYSCKAVYANGNYACKVEVKSKGGILYAFPNGETQGYRIENAPYNAPRAYYIYWGSTPIYF